MIFFVHKGGKLEKRQFLAKMHQIAPNGVSNFKIFRVSAPDAIPGEGDTPSPDPSPARRFVPRLVAEGLRPLDGPPPP